MGDYSEGFRSFTFNGSNDHTMAVLDGAEGLNSNGTSWEAKTSLIFSTIFIALLILSVLENAIVVYIIQEVKRLQSTTTSLITQLALTDLTFSCICIPHSVYQYHAKSYELPELICKFANFFNHLTAYVSIYADFEKSLGGCRFRQNRLFHGSHVN
ncbi:hypothetical protein ACOME3_008835 [Neoechinorhynchus agilis]